MNTLTEQIFTPWFHTPILRTGSHSPTFIPPERTAPPRTTGTEDDDDEPEDEHPGENEASERQTTDGTEAPAEFEDDDEDRGSGA